MKATSWWAKRKSSSADAGRDEVSMEQQVKDKAEKPKGLMPRNLQALIIAGIALLMILIMALTGHKRPKMPTAAAAGPPVPTAVPANQQKIQDFQKQIQQEQVKSAPQIEAALLQQQRRLAAERQLTGDPENPYGVPVGQASQTGAYPAGAYAAREPQRTPDPIKEAQEKLRYESLFAGNVALTYRKHAPGMQPDHSGPAGSTAYGAGTLPAEPANPNPFGSQQRILDQEQAELVREEQMLNQAQGPRGVSKADFPGSADPVYSSGHSKEASRVDSDPPNPYVAKPGALSASTGKKYVLFEGTVIDALLVNRLNGSFAGPVTCMVTSNVYSQDRQHLLIPAGSKVFGEAKRVNTFGQSRLAVTFDRLLMPDGYSVNLDQFTGLGQQGATALKGKVNNHYAKIFGASLALGILGGAAELGTGGVLTAGGSDLIRQGFGISMATSGERVMDRFLNQMPTVTIPEGTRVKIYLSNDLLLPDYNHHKVRGNL